MAILQPREGGQGSGGSGRAHGCLIMCHFFAKNVILLLRPGFKPPFYSAASGALDLYYCSACGGMVSLVQISSGVQLGLRNSPIANEWCMLQLCTVG